MPTISEFFGISIYMYYAHGKHKAPYFHAQTILSGHLPPKVVKLIQEWAKTYKRELLENLVLITHHEIPMYIEGADK